MADSHQVALLWSHSAHCSLVKLLEMEFSTMPYGGGQYRCPASYQPRSTDIEDDRGCHVNTDQSIGLHGRSISMMLSETSIVIMIWTEAINVQRTLTNSFRSLVT